jgi:hypothetical protein
MSVVSYLIFVTSLLLEIVVLWRIIHEHLWWRLIGLTCYITYELAAAFVLFGVLNGAPNLYRRLYWESEIVSLTLGFLVFWDVFRHTFPQTFKLRGLMFNRLAVVGLVSIISAGSLWVFACYRKFHYLARALEHGLGFLLASLILVVLLAAKHYQVQLGRNVWGIAFGLGGYASISTVIFGVTDLTRLFIPYMQILRPLAFVAMLGLWTWAIWIYAPNQAVDDHLPTPGVTAWASWSDGWRRALSMVRRAIDP